MFFIRHNQVEWTVKEKEVHALHDNCECFPACIGDLMSSNLLMQYILSGAKTVLISIEIYRGKKYRKSFGDAFRIQCCYVLDI